MTRLAAIGAANQRLTDSLTDSAQPQYGTSHSNLLGERDSRDGQAIPDSIPESNSLTRSLAPLSPPVAPPTPTQTCREGHSYREAPLGGFLRTASRTPNKISLTRAIRTSSPSLFAGAPLAPPVCVGVCLWIRVSTGRLPSLVVTDTAESKQQAPRRGAANGKGGNEQRRRGQK